MENSNTGDSNLLNDQDLELATYRLLTSNTLHRYTRMAKRSAEPLREEVSSLPSKASTYIKSARDLWKHVLNSPRRGSDEVKLAVLLAALRDVQSVEVDRLLTTIAISSSPSVAWLAGLSRQLLEERPRSLNFPKQEDVGEVREDLGATETDFVLS